MKKPLIVIAGPTACGKTDLSINLAEKIGGEIISGDSMQGLGYKEFIPYFNGEISLEKAVDDIKKYTRHFAKRQLTWFRRQTEGIWIDMTDGDKEKALSQIINEIEKRNIV